MDDQPIINRVAKSPLKSIDLEDYFPKEETVVYDIADNLYNGMILREKDFRAFVKEHNWQIYKDKYVALNCSVDAIVPTWAYMLLAAKINTYAKVVEYGDKRDLIRRMWHVAVEKIEQEDFNNSKVVVKGCGNLPDVEYGFVALTNALVNKVTSLMYGEPCSTVPVYKRPKK